MHFLPFGTKAFEREVRKRVCVLLKRHGLGEPHVSSGQLLLKIFRWPSTITCQTLKRNSNASNPARWVWGYTLLAPNNEQ